MEHKVLTAFEFLYKKKKKKESSNLKIVLSFGKTNKKSALDLETALVNLLTCSKLGISARFWKWIYLIHLRFLHQVPDFDTVDMEMMIIRKLKANL